MNNGYMKTKPYGGKCVSSSICNRACRMCIPDSVKCVKSLKSLHTNYPKVYQKHRNSSKAIQSTWLLG